MATIRKENSKEIVMRFPVRLSLKDAIVLSHSNDAFLESFLSEPDSYSDLFNLGEREIEVLKTISPDRIKQFAPLVTNPSEFAKTVGMVSDMISKGSPYD